MCKLRTHSVALLRAKFGFCFIKAGFRTIKTIALIPLHSKSIVHCNNWQWKQRHSVFMENIYGNEKRHALPCSMFFCTSLNSIFSKQEIDYLGLIQIKMKITYTSVIILGKFRINSCFLSRNVSKYSNINNRRECFYCLMRYENRCAYS